jgi:putative NADH-flavin reductase
MYAMICTGPDVSYVVSVISRYQSNPGEAHWVAVKNILKYLQRTKDKFLVYGGSKELVVNGYTLMLASKLIGMIANHNQDMSSASMVGW